MFLWLLVKVQSTKSSPIFQFTSIDTKLLSLKLHRAFRWATLVLGILALFVFHILDSGLYFFDFHMFHNLHLFCFHATSKNVFFCIFPFFGYRSKHSIHKVEITKTKNWGQDNNRYYLGSNYCCQLKISKSSRWPG